MKQFLINTAIFLSASIASIICCDLTLRLIEPQETRTIFKNGKEIKNNYFFSPRDPNTTMFKPNLQFTRKLASNRETIFECEFSTDKFGRRTIPLDLSERSKSLLLFGDSMAFGSTVNSNQSLSYYFGKILKDYAPYNYAVIAGGMHTFYPTIKGTDLKKQVPQKDSLAIYLYYNFHVKRLQHDYRNLANYYNGYEMNSSELKIIPKPLFSQLLAIFHDSILFEKFATYFLPPPPLQDKDYELAARLIEESAKEYKRQIPTGKFLVVVVDKDPKIIQKLKEKKITFINVPYSELHYKADGNIKMASHIVKTLVKEKILKNVRISNINDESDEFELKLY